MPLLHDSSHIADRTPSRALHRPWLQIAAVVGGLGALATQVPGPVSMVATASGGRPANGPGVADAAMLYTASAVVWGLLGWLALVGVVAVVSRIPGAIGTAAAAGLRALAPVAVRNVVLTVVGASVVTGIAGCSTPAHPAAPVAGTAVGGTAVAADAPDAGAQRRAERLIGMATLQISDRIAVEGSAVRRGASGAGPAAGAAGPPDIDWPGAATPAPPPPPTTSAPPTSAPGTSAPVTSAPVTSASRSPTPRSPASTTAAPRTPAPQTVAPAGPHHAAPGPGATESRTRTGRQAPTVDVDWPGPAARSTEPADASVVVLRGDSLWSIAARSLPADADDARIDRTWRAWYAANTAVIGSNPDYLLPGQILRPPTPGTVAP